MKKIIICLFAVLCLTGCGVSENKNLDVNNNVENETNSIDTSSMDFMEKYIYSLPSDEDRTNFLSFYNSITSYCSGLEYELSEMNNTNSYTFDPTKQDEIPSVLSDNYDFSLIKFFKGFSSHNNFKMTVVNENVSLSFDGIEFYPVKNNYGYSEVQKLVEKYNS